VNTNSLPSLRRSKTVARGSRAGRPASVAFSLIQARQCAP